MKDRDAISAILFSTPLMCAEDKGDVLLTCCRSASALSKCPAIVDVDVLCLLVHVTVDMLSQNKPM